MGKLSSDDLTGERSPGRLLRRIHRLLVSRIDCLFVDTDISVVQWMAMKLIRDGIGSTAGELAKGMHLATGATTRLIDSLEEIGYVSRENDLHDRRVTVLRLTRKGEAKHREKIPAMLSSWNEILADFSAKEVDDLISLLVKLHSSMERVADAGESR